MYPCFLSSEFASTSANRVTVELPNLTKEISQEDLAEVLGEENPPQTSTAETWKIESSQIDNFHGNYRSSDEQSPHGNYRSRDEESPAPVPGPSKAFSPIPGTSDSYTASGLIITTNEDNNSDGSPMSRSYSVTGSPMSRGYSVTGSPMSRGYSGTGSPMSRGYSASSPIHGTYSTEEESGGELPKFVRGQNEENLSMEEEKMICVFCR